MKNTVIKSILEKSIENLENKKQTQVEILFGVLNQDTEINKTITLTGSGIFKALVKV